MMTRRQILEDRGEMMTKVCMFSCMYVCIYVCIHTRGPGGDDDEGMYVFMHVCMYICMYTY
jgi:hypothetical protein